MPGTLPRCSARTISTKRPLRSVMTSSCRYFAESLPRVYCSSVPRSFCRFWRSSLRMRLSSGLASSSTSPPGSIALAHRRHFVLERRDRGDELAQDRERVAGARRRSRAPGRPSRRSRPASAAAAARAAGPRSPSAVERVGRLSPARSGNSGCRSRNVTVSVVAACAATTTFGSVDGSSSSSAAEPSGVSASAVTASTMRSNSRVRVRAWTSVTRNHGNTEALKIGLQDRDISESPCF